MGNKSFVNKIFGASGSYLKHEHVKDEPFRTVILSAKHEVVEFNGEKNDRIVCELDPVANRPDVPGKVSATKRLAKQIASALGTQDLNEWAGQEVEFFAGQVQAWGKTHDVVCARKGSF
jgi:hypothetical protein